MEKEQFYYDNKIVKMFLWATILWGIVGMLVGLLVALLFIYPGLLEFAGADNAISWLSFGYPAYFIAPNTRRLRLDSSLRDLGILQPKQTLGSIR